MFGALLALGVMNTLGWHWYLGIATFPLFLVLFLFPVSKLHWMHAYVELYMYVRTCLYMHALCMAYAKYIRGMHHNEWNAHTYVLCKQSKPTWVNSTVILSRCRCCMSRVAECMICSTRQQRLEQSQVVAALGGSCCPVWRHQKYRIKMHSYTNSYVCNHCQTALCDTVALHMMYIHMHMRVEEYGVKKTNIVWTCPSLSSPLGI